MEVKKDSLKAWILAARPKTLTGAAVPVMIGLALAWADIHQQEVECLARTAELQADIAPDWTMTFKWIPAILCILFAFIMQIDANFVNDYFDYFRGTDDRETRLGPERACSQGWVSIGRMKCAIVLTTALACVVGFPLVFYGGWELILVGVLCVAFCFLYTTYFSYIGLGDVLVLVFFGLVPVCMTYYVQTLTVTLEVLLASLACGLVIDALLLVNNFRDRNTDREAGKVTLVVRIGGKAALRAYLGVGVVACLMGGYFAFQGHWLASVLPLAYLLLHYKTYRKMQSIWEGRALNQCLGETARNIFVYGLLVAVGVLLSC